MVSKASHLIRSSSQIDMVMESSKKFKKVFLTGFFVFSVVFNMTSFTPQTHAWWLISDIIGDLATNLLGTLKEQLNGALAATIKAAAMSAMSSQVGQMIGGKSTSDALMISDWGDFLYQRPAAQAQLNLNDFYSISTRGKFASANYLGVGDSSSNVAGNYTNYLVSQAQQSIGSEASGNNIGISYDLDSFTASPELLFAEGDYRGLNALISNPANNPFGYTLSATAYYARQMNMGIEQAKVKAQSSGFLGKEVNGRTITPAATVETMLSDVQNIGNNVIAAAENPGILTGVIQVAVNKIVTNMIQKGVGKIQANIDKEIKRVDNQVVQALNKANAKLGPAAQFTKEWSQKSDVVKSYTSAPPQATDSGVDCSSGAC